MIRKPSGQYGRRPFRSGGNFSSKRGGFNKFNRSQSKRIDPQKYVSKAPVMPVETQEVSTVDRLAFSEFELNSELLRNVLSKGYETTTPIQAQAIPKIMAGEDILGISSTGSGKTGAFLIPIINKILKDSSQRLIVLAPTRELAQQIQKEAISLVRGTFIRVEVIIGGESIGRQAKFLQKGPHIVVGTPGRVNDMKERGFLNLKIFNNVVLDEVDRMLDMGFVHDIKKIIGLLGEQKQMLFFSATIDDSIKRIVNSLSQNYKTIELSHNKPVINVHQDIIEYGVQAEKIDALHNLLIREDVTKSIIFIETKRFVDKVGRELADRGFKVGVIHGDKTQSRRKRVIELYRESKITILVATNVAARGLDIDDISHVINYDEPQTYDEYIHRIGRTGRNGKSGAAYTFVPKR